MRALSLVLLVSCGKTAAPPPAGFQANGLAINEIELTSDQVKTAHVELATVGDQDLASTIITSGRVTFDDSLVSHVYSPVAGRITRIDAKLGDHVKKGATLAVISSPDIGGASSDVAKADADMVAAQHNYDRYKGLFDKHAASELDLETAEDTYRKAKAELERANERLALMHGGGGVSQGYSLRAEIEGDVMARNVSPGMEVSGQYATGGANELFTIGRLDRVWVLADLYEIDLPKVGVGDNVDVTTVSYPDRVYHGKVDWVSTSFDPTARTARVRCTFDNADQTLRAEMYATVRIKVGKRRGLAVPRDAIFRMGDFTYAFIVRDTASPGMVRFARVPVAADEGQPSGLVEVMSGLKAGERVAIGGVAQLRSVLDNTGISAPPPIAAAPVDQGSARGTR
ncbi:MAG TPA: efflux RND transporter periplasmic adaptor subunit [Kofleriaceae bacterium]|nr:efflux RND transporter periplasmic adaptor subunit [Kofleriaceae bacterium]